MDSFTIWILVYFVLASAFFRLDKNGDFGLRNLYNLGRTEDDIKVNPEKGFVYGQNTKNKLAFAVIFDFVLTSIFWYFNALDTGVKILLGFVSIPVVFFGFWFGGKLLILFSKGFTSTIETIDDIETGKIDPKQKVSEVTGTVKDLVSDKLEKATDNVKGAVDETINTVKDTLSSKQELVEDKYEINTSIENDSDLSDEKALDALKRFQKGGK